MFEVYGKVEQKYEEFHGLPSPQTQPSPTPHPHPTCVRCHIPTAAGRTQHQEGTLTAHPSLTRGARHSGALMSMCAQDSVAGNGFPHLSTCPPPALTTTIFAQSLRLCLFQNVLKLEPHSVAFSHTLASLGDRRLRPRGCPRGFAGGQPARQGKLPRCKGVRPRTHQALTPVCGF